MFDAIIVGARCAGSPLGMLLARRGHRVLVIDKATFPSDVISTHFLHPRGASYLQRWGLFERLMAAGTPAWSEHCTTMEGISLRAPLDMAALRARFAEVHGWSGEELDAVTMRWCAPRRHVLDSMLAEAAAEAGAEVRLQVTMTELIREGDRVVGIRARAADGTELVERAAVVVGADGRRSPVAEAVGAAKYHERPRCTYSYYSYWERLSLEGLRWPLHIRGRQSLAAFPTNGGRIHVLVFGPRDWFDDFRADHENNYRRAIDLIYPELGQRLGSARRVEPVYGTADQPNFFRTAAGPGWALVGDAGLQQDQCTAIGMTHAFRDAELLSGAISDGLSGALPMDQALADYVTRRDADSVEYHHFLADVAECNPPRLEQELGLFAAMRENPAQISRFFSVFTDALAPSAFFAPESMQAVFSAARTDLPEPEIFGCYNQRLEEALRNPWARA